VDRQSTPGVTLGKGETMPRFLIEVPHGETKEECERAVNVFMSIGSHFISNADWGCSDNVHKAWINAEFPSKSDALNILPPGFRRDAIIVQLETFTPTQLAETVEKHT
jgi:hypothetical protein